MKVCSIDGCDKQHYSRTWCMVHYGRWKRQGDPNIKLPPFNRGYQSPETRAKISASTMGKKKSLEMRLKLSEAKKGANALHLWKGGISPINTRIRRSAEYRIWREKVYERDDYTCQICKERGGRLNADHIKPFAEYPELRFDLNNGRTLCEPCHVKTPTFGRWKKIKEL